MKYFRNRIRSAAEIVGRYRAPEPFHLHLKKWFKAQKKFGSRDRREIRELCYCYMRVGAFTKGSLEEQLIRGWLILNASEAAQMEDGWSQWESELIDQMKAQPADSRFKTIKQLELFDEEKFNRLSPFLSSDIDQEVYFRNLLNQPYTWIRSRIEVDQLLKLMSVEPKPEIVKGKALAFKAATPLDKIPLDAQKQFVIQDIASQDAINLIQVNPGSRVWDVCSGAGGKSLALLDNNDDLDLCSSDIRPGILKQLRDRLGGYGYDDFSVAQFDATVGTEQIEFVQVRLGKQRIIPKNHFDYVLCDVPCSGSGTWSRTPEDHLHFDESRIDIYAKRQLEILSNASHFVRRGGELWYMTCSVFEKENEEIVQQFVAERPDFQLVGMGYCDHLSDGGDCLFYAQVLAK